MNENGHNEFKSLRDKLNNFRVDPPGELWDHISAGIGNRGKRRKFIILLASAASLALAISLGLMLRDMQKVTPPEFIENIPVVREQPSPEKTRLAESGEDSEVIPESRDNIQEKGYPEGDRTHQGKLERKVAEAIEAVAAVKYPDVETLAGITDDGERKQVETEIKDDPEMIQAETDFKDDREKDQTGSGITDDGQTDRTLADTKDDLEEEQIEAVSGQTLIVNDKPFEAENRIRDPRWIVGGIISPLYSYRNTEGILAAGSAEQNVESAMIAYAGGIHVGFQPFSRLTIESGIIFNKMGLNIGEVSGSSLFGTEMDFSPIPAGTLNAHIVTVTNSIGNIVSYGGDIFLNNYKSDKLYGFDSFTVGRPTYGQVTYDGVRQNLQYLEIPFNMRYSVIDRSVELQLTGGISTNFLVNNFVTAQTANGTEEIGYVSNLNNVNYSGNAGIGMIYHFHANLSFSIEPRLRYYLNSINDLSLIHISEPTRPY